MKHWLLIGGLFFVTVPSWSQNSNVQQIIDQAEKEFIEQFDPGDLNPNQLLVRVPYSSKRLLNLPEERELAGREIRRIDLVYSDYPKNNESRQQRLNQSRMQELAHYLPAVLQVPNENWGLIVQTRCHSRAEASRLFHGFVLTLSENWEVPDFSDVAELSRLSRDDSTVFNVMKRNQGWKKMLVVTDLTSSMTPYTAQLLIWFKLNEKQNQVEYFVFFNDGDERPDAEKKIGNTGGIYSGKASSFEEIADLATRTVAKGFGGDVPENNIEALLHGLEKCSDCEAVVMIADNWASPRDLALLDKVQVPVKIILCGSEQGINVDYLNIARRTGGSVHTIEKDILDLMSVNEGEEFRIGKEIFIIKNGRFELLRRI